MSDQKELQKAIAAYRKADKEYDDRLAKAAETARQIQREREAQSSRPD